MRILVTGGTGLLGRRLVARLLARGDEVVVLTREPARAAGRMGAARLVAWDPLAEPVPPGALAGAGAVVNLLGEPIAAGRWTAARKERIRASRVLGTRSLVAGIAAAERPPAVLVSGSATGWYGPRGDEELDESAPAAADYLGQLCRDWEAEARRAEPAGTRVVLLRTGIVLSPEGGALAKLLPLFRLGFGGPVGSGRQWLSWIHVEDLCALVVHALDRAELIGPVNGTAPNPVRNRDFGRALGRALGRPALLPVPAFAMRLVLGEMAQALLLTGHRVVPRRALATGFRFAHPDLDGALADLLKRG